MVQSNPKKAEKDGFPDNKRGEMGGEEAKNLWGDGGDQRIFARKKREPGGPLIFLTEWLKKEELRAERPYAGDGGLADPLFERILAR